MTEQVERGAKLIAAWMGYAWDGLSRESLAQRIAAVAMVKDERDETKKSQPWRDSIARARGDADAPSQPAMCPHCGNILPEHAEVADAAVRRCIAGEWRENGWGDPETALFVGRICVGSIMLGSPTHHPGEWRGWLMTSDEGDEIGWYPTASDARKAVEKAAHSALLISESSNG